MSFDAREFIEEGYSTDTMASAIEVALWGIRSLSSKESKYLENLLMNIRDECESYPTD